MTIDVDKIKRDMVAAALKQDVARVREKLKTRQLPMLFDALESIGATMDEHWHGEWTGPILFNDPKGASRMILVEQSDHDLFEAWYRQHIQFTDEELQDHGREALVRMCSRPIDPKDYA